VWDRRSIGAGFHKGLLPLRAGGASKGCATTQFRLQSFVNQMKGSSAQPKLRARNNAMARPRNLENLSYADLAKMEQRIAQLKLEKQNEERAELRRTVADMVKAAGFDIDDLFGKVPRAKGGKVAPKYRDPQNPANTWTGRGRMPRWMVAATKGGRARREDFLI
jgi:DNA-binding protein H-NS